MYKHVLETLGEYQDRKFLNDMISRVDEAYDFGQGKADKNDDKKEDKTDKKKSAPKKKEEDPKKALAVQLENDTNSILDHVTKNWERFKRDAKDNVRAYKSYWDILKKCKEQLGSKYGVLECYALFGSLSPNGAVSPNNEFKIASIREKGKTKLVLFDSKEGESVVLASSKASDRFIELMKKIKTEFLEAKNNYVANAAREKQQSNLVQRKDAISRLGQASKGAGKKAAPKKKEANESSEGSEDEAEKKTEDESVNETYGPSDLRDEEIYDVVAEELYNLGYNEQEADFILGDLDIEVFNGISRGVLIQQAETIAKELASQTMGGLKESLNEGSYDEFMYDNSQEISHAIKTLKAIQYGLAEGEISEEELVSSLERIEDIYDPEVVNFLDDKLFGGSDRISPREITDVGLNILNNHGTEMSMILNAIADLEPLAPNLYDDDEEY